MKALVVYGSKRGGTQGLAEMLADALTDLGLQVTVRPAADRNRDLDSFDLVVVGGALHANVWHKDARRFVHRSAGWLSGKPVWFFSSGPLGEDAAEAAAVGPVGRVEDLMRSVGARGHRTFGGRLAADAKGFPAAAMAKRLAGDWRDPEEIRLWAKQIVSEIEESRDGH